MTPRAMEMPPTDGCPNGMSISGSPVAASPVCSSPVELTAYRTPLDRDTGPHLMTSGDGSAQRKEPSRASDHASPGSVAGPNTERPSVAVDPSTPPTPEPGAIRVCQTGC